MVSNPADAACHYDHLVCVNKAINQDAVAKSLAPVVDDTTTIGSSRTGWGTKILFEHSIQAVPFRVVLYVSFLLSPFHSQPQFNNMSQTWTGATQTSPGIVMHIKSENTEIDLFPNPSLPRALETSRLDRFASLLKAGTPRVCNRRKLSYPALGKGSLELSLECNHLTHYDRQENLASLLPRHHPAHPETNA